MDGRFYDMFRDSIVYDVTEDEETLDDAPEDTPSEPSPDPE